MELGHTLREAVIYFKDFENCRAFMVDLRWPNDVRCPRCNSDHVVYLEKARVWKCYSKHDSPKFSLKTGTVFEDSPLGLDKWLPAVWMIVNDKNGISSWELHRTLGVTQKSAWFMLHRIRLGMSLNAKRFGTNKKMGDGGEGDGAVEVDETFVGGRPKNMHRDRRLRYAQAGAIGGTTGKTVVLGMLDRAAREVRAKVVPDLKRETLQTEILRNVKYGSAVYTDELVAYEKLHWRYVHDVVNHMETYVNGRVHTNGLENFWSLLKRGLRGTYVAVEPFHLERYVD